MDTEHGAAVRIHRAVDYWAKHIVEQIRNTTMGGRVVSGGGGRVVSGGGGRVVSGGGGRVVSGGREGDEWGEGGW